MTSVLPYYCLSLELPALPFGLPLLGSVLPFLLDCHYLNQTRRSWAQVLTWSLAKFLDLEPLLKARG